MIIYAISDLHGHLDFTIPTCDLLLIAGDICPDYRTNYPGGLQEAWFVNRFIPWLQAQPAKTTLGTWGNHDWIYHKAFKQTEFGVLMFVDELVEIDGLKMWFSPWSNEFGGWAWMYEPPMLKEKYALIPEGTDIIVSHQPPFGYGDEIEERYLIYNNGQSHVGSKELLGTLDRVQPKVVICGHIHSGHGRYEHICEDDTARVKIYNVAMVNEAYQRVHRPTEIEL